MASEEEVRRLVWPLATLLGGVAHSQLAEHLLQRRCQQQQQQLSASAREHEANEWHRKQLRWPLFKRPPTTSSNELGCEAKLGQQVRIVGARSEPDGATRAGHVGPFVVRLRHRASRRKSFRRATCCCRASGGGQQRVQFSARLEH